MSREWREYLRDILEYAGYVADFTRGMSLDQFRADLRTQHAVLRDLQVVGEAVKRVPPEILARHPSVPWKRIARFRDRLAHGCFDLDLEVVWEVVEKWLPEMVTEVQQILLAETGEAEER